MPKQPQKTTRKKTSRTKTPTRRSRKTPEKIRKKPELKTASNPEKVPVNPVNENPSSIGFGNDAGLKNFQDDMIEKYAPAADVQEDTEQSGVNRSNAEPSPSSSPAKENELPSDSELARLIAVLPYEVVRGVSKSFGVTFKAADDEQNRKLAESAAPLIGKHLPGVIKANQEEFGYFGRLGLTLYQNYDGVTKPEKPKKTDENPPEQAPDIAVQLN